MSMRCTHCGSIIPPGVPQCPICGAYPDGAQAQEDPRAYQPYPKTDYQQGVPPSGRETGYGAADPANQPQQYATPAFHTYRKQVFTCFPQNRQSDYQGHTRDGYGPSGALARAISDLPQVVKGALTNPTGTLQGMVRREDRYTGGILLLLSLLFAFLAGMVLVKGILYSLFSMTSGITGLQFAESAASLNQGVGYLAGKVNVAVGGIATACQLIAAVMPVAVTTVYLCAMRKVRCSFLLLSGLSAITVLPNLAALALASVFSLITPILSLLALFFGQVVSYVLLCTMSSQIANLQPQRKVLTLSSLIGLSELTKIVLIAAVGGALMGGVIRTLTSLTNSMGSLL
jgi:hypothetical protein